jgi:hypothetical protein
MSFKRFGTRPHSTSLDELFDPVALGLEATDRSPTPRCWGRMTWTAVLVLGGRLDEKGARGRLELALKDEVAF